MRFLLIPPLLLGRHRKTRLPTNPRAFFPFFCPFVLFALVIVPRLVMAERAPAVPTPGQWISQISSAVGAIVHRAVQPNAPNSATRPTERMDCSRSAMAGFAAVHV